VIKPPRDFQPALEHSESPTVDDLFAAWEASEATRRRRERDRAWRETEEVARRDNAGSVVPRRGVSELPACVREPERLGPHSRNVLRSLATNGRVVQAGIDTWSPCWNADGRLAGALEGLATAKAGRAMMLPDPVGRYRVGWFAHHGLVFAEGHPSADENQLGCADDLPDELRRLEAELDSIGIPLREQLRAGVRRVDSTVDLRTDSPGEGLAILAGIAALSLSRGKLVTIRNGRSIETVQMKSFSGRVTGRVYDKGVEAGLAPRGRLIRHEDQRRYPKSLRRDVTEMTTAYVREQYRRRLMPLWTAAKGVRVGGPLVLARELGRAVDRGQVEVSRARSLAGYLVLEQAGVDQGAKRTQYQLARECRQLGLVVADAVTDEIEVDLGAVLEECLEADAWERRS
jgi:hypothetical protein